MVQVYAVKIPKHQSWKTRMALRGTRKRDFYRSLFFLMKKNEAYGSGYIKGKGDLLVFFVEKENQEAFMQEVRNLVDVNGFPFRLYQSEGQATLQEKGGNEKDEEGELGT